MDQSQQMRETVDLRAYLAILWRRKWVALVPILVAAAASIAAVQSKWGPMTPIYTSWAKLLIESPQPLRGNLASLVTELSAAEEFNRLRTDLERKEFLDRVINSLGPEEREFLRGMGRSEAERNREKFPGTPLSDVTDLFSRRQLRASFTFDMADRSGTVVVAELKVSSPSPLRAQNWVSTITDVIIEANETQRKAQLAQMAEFSGGQVEYYRDKLAEAETEMEEYQTRVLRQASEPTLVREQTVGVTRELSQNASLQAGQYAREAEDTRRILVEAGISIGSLDAALEGQSVAGLLRAARNMERNYVAETLNEAGRAAAGSQTQAIALSRNEQEIRTHLDRVLDRRNDLTPDLRETAMSYLVAKIRAELAGVRTQAYEEEIRLYTQRRASAPEQQMEMRRLQEKVDGYRSLLNAFLLQQASSEISTRFRDAQIGTRISILEPPQVPMNPSRPKGGRIILLSIVAGLMLGVGGVFLMEHHDPSFRDVEEIESRLKQPVLLTMPNLSDIGRLPRRQKAQESEALRLAAAERAVTAFIGGSPGYEEFRKLVLTLIHPDGPTVRSIMVTSARSGEGKSTTSICLALALAREMPQEKVMLLDMDTRRPTLNRFFGHAEAKTDGFSLREHRWSDAALMELPLSNLKLLSAAAADPEQGQAPLGVPEVRWVLGEARQRADWLIIDSPPNLPVPDALVIGQEVDGVLVVVRAGDTPRDMVRRGLDLQRQFKNNILGVVMNNASEVLPYYYDYRHYGYGYSKRG